MLYFARAGGSSSVVERLLAKEEVASSTLVFRSILSDSARQAGGLFHSGIGFADLRVERYHQLRKPKWRNGRRGGLKNRWAQTHVGSNPTFGTSNNASTGRPTAEWCNGSTRVFGAFGRGSNPCSAATTLDIPWANPKPPRGHRQANGTRSPLRSRRCLGRFEPGTAISVVATTGV